MPKVILTRIDLPEENKVTLGEGEVSIGRGSILGCDDKRISRKHGLLQVSDDGSITLVSMHPNPCFYKEQNLDSFTVLVKGQSKVLGPGDEFALLPDSFRYRVDVPNMGSDSRPPAEAENAAPSKRKRTLPGWLTRLSADSTGAVTVTPSPVASSRKRKASTGGIVQGRETPIKQEPPAPSSAASSRKRKASTGGVVEGQETPTKQEPPAVSGLPSSTTSPRRRNSSTGGSVDGNGEVESRIKQEPQTVSGSPSPSSAIEENGEARVKQEPPAMIPTSPPSSSVEQDEQVETPKKQDRNKDGYEAEYGGAAGTSSRREPCPYGAACYRRNPAHRSEESHPGDPDYPVLPECPYGTSCYRRNPQHRRDYGHTRPPATPPPPQAATPPPTKRTRRRPTTKDGDDSEDDYDYDDPFLNDDSSDDYKPTSSEDSDVGEEEDEDEESQERRRMLREAKKFTKKKKK